MKLTILILSILAIVLVAGCTIPGLPNLGAGTALTGGGGLEITSFTIEPTSVFSGASVRLVMEVTNLGGTTVPDANSLVFLTGSNFGSWNGNVDPKYDHFGKSMKAEDVVRGIPADTKRFSWSFTAPSVTAGQTRVDTFIGRVYHEYETTANGNIWIYNETEAEAAKAAGRTLYTPSFTYTKGPVGLSITITPDPVILYSGENEFTMNIKISNLASGTIYKPNSVTYTAGSESIGLSAEELNNVSLSITPTGFTLDPDCIGYKEIISGRDTTVFCTATLTSTVDTFKSLPINVTVYYGYYTEQTVSTTIQGK